MTVYELIKATGWKTLTDATDDEVGSAYVCDMLSWAMSRTHKGTAWITIQSHINVVAVASLTGCSCVVIPERIEVAEETLEAARTKNVCILSADCSSFGAAAKLSRLGVGEVSR